MIRSFEIRDIPQLNRYRRRGIFLDSLPTLTWGRTLVPAGAVLSSLTGAAGVFTAVCQATPEQPEPIIAQVIHNHAAPFARFTFAAPDSAIDSPVFTPLLEYLVKRVGARGAQNLIAEADEKTQTFEALRRSGFSIYTRQRVWKIAALPQGKTAETGWRQVGPSDEFNVRRLYNAMVPALVQQVEPAHWERLRGWVLYKGDEILAFVDINTGPRGIWSQPFIHPELEDIDLHLADLVGRLGPLKQRPVYVCLRSYSSWLALPLQDLGAQPGPHQAVMVKRLAAKIKMPELSPLPTINGGTEPTTSYYETPAKGDRV